MTRFWVVGGEYTSTDFDQLVEGAAEERYGPYSSYEQAMDDWLGLSWRQVDNCNYRYRIVEEAPVF